MPLRNLKVLVGLLVLTSAAWPQSGRIKPSPTPEETLRIHTEEIKLNVLAFDDKGNFFNDVTPADLVITENNVLHQPESVRRVPANVLIVMDTGGEMRVVKTVEQTRAVANALVNALRPGDSFAVMQYSDKAEIIAEWTNDKNVALDAIHRAKFGHKSMFIEALKLANDFLRRNDLDNKHLVLITDGTDSLGRASARFDAFQRLLATDVSIHVLSYTELESDAIDPKTKTISNTPLPPRPAVPEEVARQMPQGDVNATRVKIGPTINMDRKMIRTARQRKADLQVAQEQLEKVAADSNGEFILPGTTDEMVDKTALVAKMIDSTYVVTYAPKIPVTETRGVAERNIQVTSKRDGLIVEARRKLLLRSGK